MSINFKNSNYASIAYLDFIKKRIRQYQEKKLNEALSKVKFHLDMKKQWEQKVDTTTVELEKTEAREKVLFHRKMLDIWETNVRKIEKELNKLRD